MACYLSSFTHNLTILRLFLLDLKSNAVHAIQSYYPKYRLRCKLFLYSSVQGHPWMLICKSLHGKYKCFFALASFIFILSFVWRHWSWVSISVIIIVRFIFYAPWGHNIFAQINFRASEGYTGYGFKYKQSLTLSLPNHVPRHFHEEILQDFSFLWRAPLVLW